MCARMTRLRQLILAALLCAGALAQQAPRGVMGVRFDNAQKTPGVTIRHVAAGSPAEQAGLRPGDLLMQVDDLVALPEVVSRHIASKPPGAQVKVLYLRAGQRLSATVALGDARSVYQRAAALNDAEGQVVLGRMYLEEKNQPEACQWFRRAAEAGSAEGEVALAWCYQNGIAPFPKDEAQAVYWYRRAAEKGDARGQTALALAYGKGSGVARNDQEAVRWARTSAEQGSAAAMSLLGELYRLGAGVPADATEAARWFVRARTTAAPEETDFRKFVEQQLATLAASGKLDRAQLEAIERDEAARAAAQREATRIQTGSLHVSARPGKTQAYVDDTFRGMTSDSGGELLIEGLTPGAHRLRLSHDGHKDLATTVVITAAAITPLEAALERSGPKPLTAAEVEEALRNGVAGARIREMVRQYGVDFALTEEVERRLRSAGADDALLLAIAKAKRS